jgi:hypothetical protein
MARFGHESRYFAARVTVGFPSIVCDVLGYGLRQIMGTSGCEHSRAHMPRRLAKSSWWVLVLPACDRFALMDELTRRPTLYGMVIVAGLLSVVSCGACGKPQGEAVANADQASSSRQIDIATCQDLSSRALAVLTNAAASVAQCAVGTDCKEIVVPADCLSSCVTVVGNGDVRNAILSKADELASVCRQFHEKRCTVSEGGCPARPNSYSCVMSQCTQP